MKSIVSPIHALNESLNNNNFYIKRDDLLPFSFGGNKYKKAILYFDYFKENNIKSVITVGSDASNHCRIIANMAKQRNIECHIIFTKQSNKKPFNTKIIKNLEAIIHYVNPEDLTAYKNTLINQLEKKHKNPYYLPSGGHGVLGTKAYHLTYNEIMKQFKTMNIELDYIFFASGTGTTEAGLRVGNLLNNNIVTIHSISVVRLKEEGINIIRETMNDYLKYIKKSTVKIGKNIDFHDNYLKGGYTKYDDTIKKTIADVVALEGIMLDPVYTAKAYYGMKEIVKLHNINNKNILFIHTGGAPIYFDFLND